MEATGAMEELLLLQRPLVDRTLYPLLEAAPLGDLLQHFQATLLDLKHQEPAFWQLKVVEVIRDVLKKQIGGCVRDAVSAVAASELQDPVEVVSRIKDHMQRSSELAEAMTRLKSDVEAEVVRLTNLLSAGEENYRIEKRDEHFLEQFWEKLQAILEVNEQHPKLDEERDVEAAEDGFESCSFEMLTFDDDLNDVSRSAMSFPCMEDFPATVRRMQSTDALERMAGLDELVQMPVVEIIHSGPIFPAACSAVVGLFLDVGIQGERSDNAARAKRVMFELMNQVEDAAQFLELYWAVLEFMGAHLEAGDLFLDRHSVCGSTDAHTIAVLDSFRILHELLCRVMRHWVYFSAESLARLLYSTFWLLTMYSKTESEVEAKKINPLWMLCLLDDSPVQWFKQWLLNCPNPQQLFVALDGTGFIADLLQFLSRVRPLALVNPSNSIVDGIEKRTKQCALIVVSYTCEYKEGRELLSRWQRLPAHAYIGQRLTSWASLALESNEAENDSLYRMVRPKLIHVEFRDSLDANYDHLGTGVLDALLLATTSIIVTTPKPSEENDTVIYNEQWANSICCSTAAYAQESHFGDLLPGLLKIIELCLADQQPRIYSTTQNEEKNAWFPFRQPKNATEVCQLVSHSILKRVQCGTLSSADVQLSGQWILQMVLSSKYLLPAATQLPDLDLMKLVFQLCKRILQSTLQKDPQRALAGCENRILSLTMSALALPNAFKAAKETGVVNELWKAISLLPARHEDNDRLDTCDYPLATLWNSVSGIRFMHGMPPMNHFVCEWHRVATFNCIKLLGYLSLPVYAKQFFRLEDVQVTMTSLVAKLQESTDFTMALNSPDDEWPALIREEMKRLQLMRCYLSTQYASSSLLSIGNSPLLGFIARTLASHKLGACMSSCHAEDTCCVAFQLALSLISSVPAMLECSSLFSELKLLDLDAKSAPQRDLLYSGCEAIGSCSLLEKQFCYEYEFIGGSSEKLPRCELFMFDKYSRQYSTIDDSLNTICSDGISAFALTLQNKILQAIEDGVHAGLSTPMDFVLISQASWELINELETGSMVSSSLTKSKSMAAFTGIFAKLMHNLVMSSRSRLGPLVDTDDVCSVRNDESFFPADSQRKLMNRLYKNYARELSLDASPTLLHCVVKKFGVAAMDCFSITVLMILHPVYDEPDILLFLSRCIRSQSAKYLWSNSVLQSCNGAEGTAMSSSVLAIAEGVEIILRREFPQVLQAIEQCHCSLLGLVMRWNGQFFWNYFDWENIVIYAYFSILYGAEFQVYTIVAILKHLEPTMRDLRAQHNCESLEPFFILIREPIRDFHFGPWRTLLLRLRSEYHEEVIHLLFPPS